MLSRKIYYVLIASSTGNSELPAGAKNKKYRGIEEASPTFRDPVPIDPSHALDYFRFIQ